MSNVEPAPNISPLSATFARQRPFRRYSVKEVYHLRSPGPLSPTNPPLDRPSWRIRPDVNESTIIEVNGSSPTNTTSRTRSSSDPGARRSRRDYDSRASSAIFLGSIGSQGGTLNKNDICETRLVIGLTLGETYTGISFATPSGTKCPLEQITSMIDLKNVTKAHDQVTRIASYTLKSFTAKYRRITTTDLVVTTLTHPSYEALSSVYKAVSRAGFNRVNFPKLNDIIFVSETEAAARFMFQYSKEVKSMDMFRENSYFIVCDVGHDYVDVVLYKVITTKPTLELQQIGNTSGAKCGSTFINEQFKTWLRRTIGDSYYRLLDPYPASEVEVAAAMESPSMRALMMEFNKRRDQFTAEEQSGIRINLPSPLHHIEIPGIVQAGVLTISRIEMESFFDNCLIRIIQMLRDQIRLTTSMYKGGTKRVLLIGDFGSSKYLRYHLKECMREYCIDFRALEMLRKDASRIAIVKGATLCGIHNARISSFTRGKPCPCSYGIAMDEVFQDTLHDPANATLIGGGWFLKAQLTWLVNEDDLIPTTNIPWRVEKEFDIDVMGSRDKAVLPIYRHSKRPNETDEDRPDHLRKSMPEVSKVVELTIDLRKVRRYTMPLASLARFSSRYQSTLKLVLDVKWDNIRASLWWEKHILDEATIVFVNQ